ncbi:MAG: ATP-binding protein, partial [Dehalococcoidia bacterium]
FQTMTREGLEALSSLAASIYIPLAGREALEGVLAVGPKPRQTIYSWQEMEFLKALGHQGAMLLESIRLSEADRAQRERMDHMREIQRYMVQARDEERRSLASEIHDEPIQMLVGSVVRLNLIRDSLVTRPDLSQEQIDHVIANLGRAEQSLRRIMTGVFPSLLQDLGLLAALEALCQGLEHSGVAMSSIHLTAEVKGVPSDWDCPLAVGIVVYRFIQEGLRNVLAHSGATEAWVTVEYGPESATMEVMDNGHGVDPQRVLSRRQEGHVGLLGLEERLGAFGGSITLSNRPEGGARLSGQFPHESPSPDQGARWSFDYDFTPLPVSEPAVETTDKAPVKGHS